MSIHKLYLAANVREPNQISPIKVKVKLSLCLNKHYATKAYWGSRGIVPGILDLMEVSGQIHVPAAFFPVKEPLLPTG